MLLSKWATEADSAKDATSEPPSKPKEASPKLVSKWADAEEESQPTEAPLSPQSSKRRAHRKSPRKLNRREIQKEQPSRAEKVSDSDDDEPGPRGEMSAAAMDFARRLNLGESSEKGTTNNSGKPTHRRGAAHDNPRNNGVDPNKSRNFKAQDNQTDSELETLPAIGPAGRSLAARLGIKVAEPPKGPKNQHERKLNERNPTEKVYSGEEKRYMTPRQRRDEEKKNERAAELAKQKEHDEKLKKEVSDMFEKMSDKHTNWADLEDDDF